MPLEGEIDDDVVYLIAVKLRHEVCQGCHILGPNSYWKRDTELKPNGEGHGLHIRLRRET